MLCDALQTLLQIVSFQRSADLPDQVFLVSLKVHAVVAYFRDIMIVHRFLMFLCLEEKNTKKERVSYFVN